MALKQVSHRDGASASVTLDRVRPAHSGTALSLACGLLTLVVILTDPASCVSLDSILAKLCRYLTSGTLVVLLDACRSLSMTKSEVLSENYSFDPRCASHALKFVCD
jgi:hypothetical protein